VHDRAEQIFPQIRPGVDERGEQLPVRVGIGSEGECGLFDRPSCQHGRAVVERMRNGGGWLDEVELEPEGLEEG
jgi:hypothetical protein